MKRVASMAEATRVGTGFLPARTAASRVISIDQLAPLDAVSRIELGFPTDFLHRPFVCDFLPGGRFDRIKR